MKKLRLELEDLEVSSFAAEKAQTGAVHAMAATLVNTCRCTAEVGCYHTRYCTGPGCVITAYYGCMTNDQGAC
ncbi:hypothetical protein [Longimicrobium sp.]|uniref:hypothetical protein n=1 Tax=Longimicrobium sp. TaxID=2029185 RepID=UPI003B3B8245